MTSTNFCIGLTEKKSSSRVLRPPGGGHTDIFGAEQPPPKKDSGRNASSILEGTNEGFAAEKKEVVKPAEPKPEVKPAEQAPPPVQQRVRVPPGGFSSGLW